MAKLAYMIVSDYGIEEQNANFIIETWLGVVIREKLPDAFGGNTAIRQRNQTNPPVSHRVNMPSVNISAVRMQLQTNMHLSVADVREIFFRTKSQLMQKCRFSGSQDMETWDVLSKFITSKRCPPLLFKWGWNANIPKGHRPGDELISPASLRHEVSPFRENAIWNIFPAEKFERWRYKNYGT